ncbi:uncharacterized protein LOC132041649 [Lycium ferocissimum]|uniref:uncharacterized protein LOC132041649 n=1 Tax=Lycium ferocissimum TaxID=112874 RepID=UPI00281610B7|nr:uncharacterized protein LOC132041649 [Lycium ferocissimum]
MEKMLSVHSKKANKQPKNTKKKPVKVVYIANPMKVNTSAAEFRALVQQLTGQDAKYPVMATTTTETVGSMSGTVPETNNECEHKKGLFFVDKSQKEVVHPQLPSNDNYLVYNTEAATTDNSDLSFEDYVGGEDYVPELLDNLPLAATNLWYD